MAGSFVADRDLYADRDGKVVEANDPTKVTKIASKGSAVADADVQKYGLSNLGASEDESDTQESDDSPDADKSTKKATKKSKK